VFGVITFLTLAMVITGSVFADRGRRTQDAARRAAAGAGSVPEEHLAVIAVALTVHTTGLTKGITLMADGGTGWASPVRGRPGGVHIPRLRRTR
jgi:hypothetical protein